MGFMHFLFRSSLASARARRQQLLYQQLRLQQARLANLQEQARLLEKQQTLMQLRNLEARIHQLEANNNLGNESNEQ